MEKDFLAKFLGTFLIILSGEEIVFKGDLFIEYNSVSIKILPG